MRGKGRVPAAITARRGITPAYAGKRLIFANGFGCPRDHPRVCGEKTAITGLFKTNKGSPPRMRGKVKLPLLDYSPAGITPAYAGKSSGRPLHSYNSWDHPRVCGEKSESYAIMGVTLGSPPRMRGKGVRHREGAHSPGITPAYAGKRVMRRRSFAVLRDHPRVCGEKTKKIPSHRPFQLHPVPVSFSFA